MVNGEDGLLTVLKCIEERGQGHSEHQCFLQEQWAVLYSTPGSETRYYDSSETLRGQTSGREVDVARFGEYSGSSSTRMARGFLIVPRIDKTYMYV